MFMIKGINKRNISSEIAHILRSVDNHSNIINGVYIDESLREFFLLKEEIVIPAIPVSEIDDENTISLTAIMSGLIPEFLKDHFYLEHKNPRSEQHAIHFARLVEGRTIDMVHMLRLDFKFTGTSGTIITSGDTGTYPSFSTDRLYYKSRLVPVVKGSDISSFESLRLKDAVKVNTDRRLFTSVLFDEFNTREISIELSRRAGSDNFRIPVTIYPFITYDYFTACMNIPLPFSGKITEGALILEPLFLYLYCEFKNSECTVQDAGTHWKESIDVNDGIIKLNSEFKKKLSSFFSDYNVYTDEELMIKGCRRIAEV